jgi:hypothetical protein
MKTVNLAYIDYLYNYLYSLTDEWLEENFNMNRPEDRAMFFEEAKKTFQQSGPKTQARAIEAMEFILSEPDIEKYWDQVIPHDLGVTVFTISTDKRAYLRSLFETVVGRKPREDRDTKDTIILTIHDAGWHPSE